MTAWASGPVTTRATCVLAPNPGPMTLDGTNAWILREPGGTGVVVVDPGPDLPEHLDALDAVVEESGARVDLVLVTHAHPDHAESAHSYSRRHGVRLRAWDPAGVTGAQRLRPGEVLDSHGVELQVVPTPGHTSDSVSLLLVEDRALLTGDTILGRGTTLVAFPDGRLGDYLDSLRRLRDVALLQGVSRVLPGHGPALDDPIGVIDGYLIHREQRTAEVREAWVMLGPEATVEAVVRRVYAGVPEQLWPVAALSVAATLDYLSLG